VSHRRKEEVNPKGKNHRKRRGLARMQGPEGEVKGKRGGAQNVSCRAEKIRVVGSFRTEFRGRIDWIQECRGYQ